jgi:hypothetical protein
VLPVSTGSNTTTNWLNTSSNHGPAAAAAANGAQQEGYPQQPYSTDYSTLQQQQQQQQQQGSAAAGFSNHKTLNPRSYYEDVAPSSWRPSDAAEAQGDYLELYRWGDSETGFSTVCACLLLCCRYAHCFFRADALVSSCSQLSWPCWPAPD